MGEKLLTIILGILGPRVLLTVAINLLEQLRGTVEATPTDLDDRILDALVSALESVRDSGGRVQ